MAALDILYEDHRGLLRLSRQLIELAAKVETSIGRALIDTRVELAKLVRVHLEREAVLVLAPLRQSSDAHHQALARRYTEELLAMRSDSTTHHAAWHLAAALADLDAFSDSVRALTQGLADRIAWEEAEVFPAVIQLRITFGDIISRTIVRPPADAATDTAYRTSDRARI